MAKPTGHAQPSFLLFIHKNRQAEAQNSRHSYEEQEDSRKSTSALSTEVAGHLHLYNSTYSVSTDYQNKQTRFYSSVETQRGDSFGKTFEEMRAEESVRHYRCKDYMDWLVRNDTVSEFTLTDHESTKPHRVCFYAGPFSSTNAIPSKFRNHARPASHEHVNSLH